MKTNQENFEEHFNNYIKLNQKGLKAIMIYSKDKHGKYRVRATQIAFDAWNACMLYNHASLQSALRTDNS